jgi:hypothetical protein
MLVLASTGGSAAQSDGFNLMLLNSTGAVCLDGTPGGFYYRPGAGNGTNKWLIELVRAPWAAAHSGASIARLDHAPLRKGGWDLRPA